MIHEKYGESHPRLRVTHSAGELGKTPRKLRVRILSILKTEIKEAYYEILSEN